MTPLSLNPWLYLPAAAVALLALWLLHIALVRDRSHARHPKPRCPKCWYDLSGARPELPITCPECGRVIAEKTDLHRTRRKPLLALLALPLLALLPALAILRGDARRIYYTLPPKWTTVETVRAGENIATLQRLRDPDERGMRCSVTSRGTVVLAIEDTDIAFGFTGWSPSGTRNPPAIAAGEDIDGDGTGDLAIFAYSGGAHCCFTVYVLALADPARIVATVDARNGMNIHRDPPTSTAPDDVLFDIPDQSFDYWNAPHAASPFPSMLYRLRSGRLEIALDRMLTPPSLPTKTLGERSEYLRSELASPLFALNPDMWSVMLDLIYSGHEDLAWSFFEDCWPPDHPAKAGFKKDFLDILSKSPQYRDFQAALAAQAEGKPIPPALVGEYVPQSLADPSPAAPNP